MNLLTLPLLIVDCQTSSTQPTSGHVIELGWGTITAEAIARDGIESLALENTLVGLPPDGFLPKTAARMTGIDARELETAPDANTVWKKFLEAANARAGVAHYARFETAFFKSLHESHGGGIPFSFDLACTHQIARKLLPGLPSASIRAVSGYLGRVLPEAHRTLPNLQATAWIWSRLAPKLTDLGVTTWIELKAWLAEKPAKRDTKSRLYLMPREARLALPKKPGVYRMFSSDGKILYVGKATCLKDRVNSYFRVRRANPRARISELMSQVHDIRVTPVETSLEAALLETDEIKTWDPPYNSSLKGRKRSLTFCSADFEEAYAVPGRGQPRGPFPSFRAFDQLNGLAVAMKTNEDTFSVFYDLDSSEALCEGLELFATKHGFSLDDPPSIAEFLKLGARLLTKTKADVDEESETEEDGDEWTAEKVCESAEKMARCAAGQARRARWLCRLTHSTVAWRLNREAPWRWLSFEEGISTARDYAESLESVPTPRAWKTKIAERQRAFDVGMYDRMAVLLAEIRRIAVSGAEFRLKLAPRLQLDGETFLRRI